MTVGSRIKERRIELGISVDELAIKLNKNRATIYRYEKDDIKSMPTTVLEPLADALHTTPAYLMGWTNDPNDWENIGNECGIYPPNDFEGSYEDYVKYKMNESNHLNFYNPYPEAPTTLTTKDKKDIANILANTELLLRQDGLMFDGEPASQEAIDSILSAMEIGMEMAKKKNKEKYTPNKYKKEM